jgi:type IV secretory pathway VirB9-like protein
MKRSLLMLLVLPALCSAFVLGRTDAAECGDAPQRAATRRSAAKSRSADTSVTSVRSGVKVVAYNDKDVVPIRTKLRYSTLIVLPKTEEILDFTTGDKDFWVVNGAQNFAYIKPAKAGAQTNLNLVTATGNVYSFALSEISEVADASPDLKVFVEPKDGTLATSDGAPRFVSAQVAEDYRQQVELAKDETRRTQQAAQDAIDRGISQFVSNVRFAYRFESGRKPFNIRTIYNDEKGFTYIHARPEETPALYELTDDNKPSLINYEYRNGVYVVTKTLERGYLAIGKKKLYFRREE